MAIDNSALMMEVQAIAAAPAPKLFMWKGTIHAGGQDIEVSKVKDHVKLRDYAKNKSDKIEIVVTIGVGDYNLLVRPNRGNLEFTLRRYEVTEREAVEIIGNEISVERFVAVPPEEKQNSMFNSLPVDVKPEDANKLGYIDLSLELMSPTVTRLRAVTVGSIFEAKSVKDLLVTVMTKYSRGVELDKERQVRGVDMVNGYNQTARKHYVVNHSVNILDFPRFIQEERGGVYAAGLGWYLQDYLWYIYPLFDTTRFQNERDTLTIVMIPENKVPRLNNSFRKTDNQLVVLVTTAPFVYDDTESIQYNTGNGARFADATRVMSGMGTAANNKFNIPKQENVYEVMANKRADGNNIAPIIPGQISDNPFVIYSNLARANTIHVQFEWINSDDKLLYPGMPTRIIRWADEDVQEEFGTLLGAESFNRLADNAQSNQYIQQTILTVGVAKTY